VAKIFRLQKIASYLYHYVHFHMIFELVYFTGGQNCIDNPRIYQNGSHASFPGRQVIVPNASINCTVRITRVAVSMAFGGFLDGNLPLVQIWRPTSPGSGVYDRVVEMKLSEGTFLNGNSGYYLAISPFSHQSDFQRGDVVGYYQPKSPLRTIWTSNTNGYTSYSNNVNSSSNTIDISNVDNVETDRQPLIELQYGKYTETYLHIRKVLT